MFVEIKRCSLFDSQFIQANILKDFNIQAYTEDITIRIW